MIKPSICAAELKAAQKPLQGPVSSSKFEGHTSHTKLEVSNWIFRISEPLILRFGFPILNSPIVGFDPQFHNHVGRIMKFCVYVGLIFWKGQKQFYTRTRYMRESDRRRRTLGELNNCWFPGFPWVPQFNFQILQFLDSPILGSDPLIAQVLRSQCSNSPIPQLSDLIPWSAHGIDACMKSVLGRARVHDFPSASFVRAALTWIVASVAAIASAFIILVTAMVAQVQAAAATISAAIAAHVLIPLRFC